jgi:hypothetical protein
MNQKPPHTSSLEVVRTLDINVLLSLLDDEDSFISWMTAGVKTIRTKFNVKGHDVSSSDNSRMQMVTTCIMHS